MNDNIEQQLRGALGRYAEDYQASPPEWYDVIRRTNDRSAGGRKWILPAAAAALVAGITVATVLWINHKQVPTGPASSGAVVSSEFTTASETLPMTLVSLSTESSAVGAVITASQDFPPATIAPGTMLTDWPSGSETTRPLFDQYVEVGWSKTGHQIVLLIFGPTSCHLSVTGVRETGDQQITIDLSDVATGNHDCTADLKPYTTVIAPPEGVESSSRLTLVILGKTYSLPPVAT